MDFLSSSNVARFNKMKEIAWKVKWNSQSNYKSINSNRSFLLPMSPIDKVERDDVIQIAARLFRYFLENALADCQHEEGIHDRIV